MYPLPAPASAKTSTPSATRYAPPLLAELASWYAEPSPPTLKSSISTVPGKAHGVAVHRSACTTVQVRTRSPPATRTAPVRAVIPAFAATVKYTVPFPLPVPPLVTASHGAFVAAVHATFAVTAIRRPPEAPAETFVFAGLIASAADAPACTTVQVRTISPPATMTAPVRAAVSAFAATLYVTVPFPFSELPPVTDNHGTFVAAVHAILATTSIWRPLEAAAETLVMTGAIERVGIMSKISMMPKRDI